MCLVTHCVWFFVTPCSPPGSSVHGIFQARILEPVTISYSKWSSWPKSWIHVSCASCIVGRQVLPSEKYRFTYIYFMLWVIINTTSLPLCSNCPSLDTEFFVGSGVSLLCPIHCLLLFWALAYSLAPCSVPGMLCVLPATVLEWAISSRISGYVYWRRVLENKFLEKVCSLLLHLGLLRWWKWKYKLVCTNREAWCAAIHGVAKSRTRLSEWSDLNHVYTHIYLFG